MTGVFLQNEYASSGLDTSYSGGQAAFAAAYGDQAGYPSNAVGASGQDAYGTSALYSQGFASASQVCKTHHDHLLAVACLTVTFSVSTQRADMQITTSD